MSPLVQEQKIFDVACCLSDVLESAPLGRESSVLGHNFLHGFMTILASFRNQESQYLRPLLARAAKTLAAELQTPRLLTPPPEEKEALAEHRNWQRNKAKSPPRHRGRVVPRRSGPSATAIGDPSRFASSNL